MNWFYLISVVHISLAKRMVCGQNLEWFCFVFNIEFGIFNIWGMSATHFSKSSVQEGEINSKQWLD